MYIEYTTNITIAKERWFFFVIEASRRYLKEVEEKWKENWKMLLFRLHHVFFSWILWSFMFLISCFSSLLLVKVFPRFYIYSKNFSTLYIEILCLAYVYSRDVFSLKLLYFCWVFILESWFNKMLVCYWK